MKNQSLKSVLMGAVVMLASVQAWADHDGFVSGAMEEQNRAPRERSNTSSENSPLAPSYVVFKKADSGDRVLGDQVRTVRRNHNQIVLTLDSGDEVRVNYYFDFGAIKFERQVLAGKTFDLGRCATPERRAGVNTKTDEVPVKYDYSTCGRNYAVAEVVDFDPSQLQLSRTQFDEVIKYVSFREGQRRPGSGGSKF